VRDSMKDVPHPFLRSRETAKPGMIRAVCSPRQRTSRATHASREIARRAATEIIEPAKPSLKNLRPCADLRPSNHRAEPFDREIKIKGGCPPVPQAGKKALPFAAKANPTGEV
jgi:hypothetical protein